MLVLSGGSGLLWGLAPTASLSTFWSPGNQGSGGIPLTPTHAPSFLPTRELDEAMSVVQPVLTPVGVCVEEVVARGDRTPFPARRPLESCETAPPHRLPHLQATAQLSQLWGRLGR